MGYLTDAEVAQTAVAQGCWSATDRATPFPATVTVTGGTPTTTPTVITNFGQPTNTPAPTRTPLPTTTPLPLCTPAPGQTIIPSATPLPTEPAYATRPANGAQPYADGVEVMRLPNAVLMMDAAVHPIASWPAVAAIDIPVVNQGEPRVFVRVYDPRRNAWTTARTVDREGSRPGKLNRSVAVGVTPDDTVHTVWGSSDFPGMELFYSQSKDYGETWAAPQSLGGPYFAVLDALTTFSNEVYVLALERADEHTVRARLLRRDAGGAWSREELPHGHIWQASSGALAVTGDGTSAAQLVVFLTAGESRPGGAWTIVRPLRGGAWVAQGHTSPDASGLLDRAAAVAFSYRVGQETRQGVTFSASLRDQGDALYALTSLDGGATWGRMHAAARTGGRISSGGIAYDPAASRLVAIWNCCGDATWGNDEATHYAAWANPMSEEWSPGAGTAAGERAPLVTQAKAAALTQVVHGLNARITWLIWLEDGQAVRARSYNLDRIIPRDQYPEPTPVIVPTSSGG